jgi:hypothetical protein
LRQDGITAWVKIVACWALLLFWFGTAHTTEAQAPEQLPARAWAETAAANQGRIINDDGTVLLRYRVRKVDAKGDVTREVIESREGSVARLIARDGQAITAAEDAAERDRLNGILHDPEDFFKHVKRDQAARGYATQLLRSMAQSMIWSYAPGQPQASPFPATQVVLDFVPDPKFKPPTLVTEALTGIAGRVWVDRNTRCVTRIEGQILHPIDFGWGGLLARIKQGGRIEFEQKQAHESRWLYSHLDEHISIREVLVRTVEENTRMQSFDVHVLPTPISYREAIQALLALPVPTR